MIKTMKKVAKNGSRTLPILRQFMVQDGIMTATNLDLWVSMNMNLEDGMYYTEGADRGMFIKSDKNIDDFPNHTIDKGERADTLIDKETSDALRYVLKAASRNPARYYLNGVFFDWSLSEGMVVATDGYRIHGFSHKIHATREKPKRRKVDGKMQTIVPNKGAIVPTFAMKIMLDIMEKQKRNSFELKFSGKTFLAYLGNVTVSGKLIDGTYPDWRQVIPDCPKENVTTFDPNEILSILPELRVFRDIYATRRTSLAIRINNGEIVDYNDPMGKRKVWPCSLNLQGYAYNATYLSELCSGQFYYLTPDKPAIVKDRRGKNKIGIIMPMRWD